MDIESYLRDPQSRRRFFQRSGVIVGGGGSAMFLAACADNTTTPNVLTGPDESDQADVEILNGALDLELMAVAAYKAGAARLRGSALAIGKKFLEQEQEHADGLAAAAIEVDAVTTGRDALAALTGAHDLVVLDLGLPDLDGTEVARAIRASRCSASPPIPA